MHPASTVSSSSTIDTETSVVKPAKPWLAFIFGAVFTGWGLFYAGRPRAAISLVAALWACLLIGGQLRMFGSLKGLSIIFGLVVLAKCISATSGAWLARRRFWRPTLRNHLFYLAGMGCTLWLLLHAAAWMFPPRRYSLSQLRQHFLSAFEASPQQGRLRYNSLFWTGPAVGYLANREPKAEKLLVYYDPSDLGLAWACHPSYPDELLELQAVDPDYQQSLTMHLHQLTLKRLRAERKSFDSHKARRARVALLHELAQVKTPAQRRKHSRAEEKGSLQRRTRRAASGGKQQPLKPAPTAYRYHDNTPDDYSSEEV